MIYRRVFSPKLMHTRPRAPHKGVPTVHCTCSRSDAARNLLKYNINPTCLFFDQVNIYANFRCRRRATWLSSTDLSTVIVDKRRSVCQTRAYTALCKRSCEEYAPGISYTARFSGLGFN